MAPEPAAPTGARGPGLRPVCLAGLLLALLAGCGSAPQGQSLGERRRAIQDGSAPGIVLIPARNQDAAPGGAATPAPAADKAAAAAAPAATSTSTSTSTSAPKATAAAAATASTGAAARGPAADAPERRTGGGFFDSLPPPSGRPMNAAKELKAPELGIPVPGSRPASGPASAK